MSSHLNALQSGIFTRLAAHSPLTAMVGSKIFDEVPQNETAPYVVIGDDTATGSDTKSGNGWEFTVTIHCWHFDTAGRKSTKTLMGHIYDALHKGESNITVTGFTLVHILCEFQECFPETVEGSADHFYHGVLRFRALVRS